MKNCIGGLILKSKEKYTRWFLAFENFSAKKLADMLVFKKKIGYMKQTSKKSPFLSYAGSILDKIFVSSRFYFYFYLNLGVGGWTFRLLVNAILPGDYLKVVSRKYGVDEKSKSSTPYPQVQVKIEIKTAGNKNFIEDGPCVAQKWRFFWCLLHVPNFFFKNEHVGQLFRTKIFKCQKPSCVFFFALQNEPSYAIFH